MHNKFVFIFAVILFYAVRRSFVFGAVRCSFSSMLSSHLLQKNCAAVLKSLLYHPQRGWKAELARQYRPLCAFPANSKWLASTITAKSFPVSVVRIHYLLQLAKSLCKAGCGYQYLVTWWGWETDFRLRFRELVMAGAPSARGRPQRAIGAILVIVSFLFPFYL